ncbi:MAG: ACT domain-containing protein, partial [Bacteroidota bacterium]
MKRIILLIHCPDQKGLIAKVTNFIAHHNGNTTYLEQHVENSTNAFFMRLECEFEQETARDNFKERFEIEIATPLEMQ